MTGPLAGLRTVELASIGPGPHAAMVLADLGAEIVRVERPPVFGPEITDPPEVSHRGRRRIVIDLKTREGADALLDLVEHADVLIEGMRPGVAERLGIGPDTCLARNPRLIYGRITGWGQDGPLAATAGHDLNYIGMTGVLHAIGRSDQSPPPPLNVLGDYGGGSMLLLVGILSALWERGTSGLGQVVDAAIVDGTSLLAQTMWALRAQGYWSDNRGENVLDGGSPFYDTYACKDGRFVAVAALEPKFFANLMSGLGLPPSWLESQYDRTTWPDLRTAIANQVVLRSRDEWVGEFSGVDACISPVLSWDEAAADEHLAARNTILRHNGAAIAAPAPRFSRTPGVSASMPDQPYTVDHIVTEWGAAPRA